LSSRNELLTASQTEVAKQIFRALTEARKLWQLGIRDENELQQKMHENLKADQIRVDYAEIRDPCNWQPDSPKGLVEQAVALIAAHIGSVRLIDNLRLD
jgi:pantothenate synthetase